MQKKEPGRTPLFKSCDHTLESVTNRFEKNQVKGSILMNVKERVERMLHRTGDANIAAFAGGFIFLVVLIIAVIAAFLDIVYVTMIWSALPAGFLQYIAAGGAILVSPVVILILLAKLFYFRAGGQQIFSYVAFAIDLAFAVLNTYCAFQIAWHAENDFVIGWRNLSPITPVVILALLAILLLLDPNAARRNKEREQVEVKRDLELRFQHEDMARQMALKELEAEFQSAQQEAAIGVRMEALSEYKKMLREELLNDDARAVLREGARRLGETAIHDLTGLPRKIVSSTAVPALPAPVAPTRLANPSQSPRPFQPSPASQPPARQLPRRPRRLPRFRPPTATETTRPFVAAPPAQTSQNGHGASQNGHQ